MIRRPGTPPRPGSFAIVPMEPDDIPGVVSIENSSFPTPWSAASFRHELLENPYARLFVVRAPDPDGVVGFACLWIVDQELKINNLAIHPLWRRRGLGRRLLKFALGLALSEGCLEATLEVRPSNGAALAMYAGEGFQTVGRRKRYYSDTHEDALVMVRPIDPARAG